MILCRMEDAKWQCYTILVDHVRGGGVSPHRGVKQYHNDTRQLSLSITQITDPYLQILKVFVLPRMDTREG